MSFDADKRSLEISTGNPHYGLDTGLEGTDSVAAARRLMLAVRARDSIFPSNMFSDHVWLLMLALYVAGAEDRVPSMKSLCIESDVSSTSALRCIQMLEEHSMVERTRQRGRSGHDMMLSLTAIGVEMMERSLRFFAV